MPSSTRFVKHCKRPVAFDSLFCFVFFLKCSNEAVFAADFHPTDTNIIVTCGKSHLYFWTLEGNSLNKKQGLFEVNCTIGSVCLRGTWEGLAFKGTSRQVSLSTCFSDKPRGVEEMRLPWGPPPRRWGGPPIP